MLPTFTEKLSPTTSQKNRRMVFTASETTTGGILALVTDRTVAEYAVAEFAADDGRGFRLVKRTMGSDATEESYDLFVPKCGKPVCECKGFIYTARGETPGHCKHADAIQQLIAEGYL